jgi:hypothetical protein
METTLPADLQSRQATINSDRQAALDALREAEKAQNELNAEIRERTK